MFAANLKSFIHHDSFKFTKNVYCSVFRSGLLDKTQPKYISQRCFITKIFENKHENPVILTVKGSIICRSLMTRPRDKLSPSPIRWKTVVITASVGLIFVGFLAYLRNKKLKAIESHRNRQLGKASLGGKFNLVNQDNKPVSSDDFLGEWLLLYFGFTHCPDICPDEIEKMVQVVDIIDKKDDMMKVKPVFITVDPERDTPGVIKKYLKEFSDKIVGLTGTVEQIRAACKAYRVYFSPGPKDSDSDYIVDHSIIMYLIDPDGNFMDYFGQNKKADDIVTSIRFNMLKKSARKSLVEKVTDYFSKD